MKKHFLTITTLLILSTSVFAEASGPKACSNISGKWNLEFSVDQKDLGECGDATFTSYEFLLMMGKTGNGSTKYISRYTNENCNDSTTDIKTTTKASLSADSRIMTIIDSAGDQRVAACTMSADEKTMYLNTEDGEWAYKRQ